MKSYALLNYWDSNGKLKETYFLVFLDLGYETNEYKYSFKNFQTIKTFGRDTYEGKVTIKEAHK